jgi:hypothetical protein
MMVSEDSSITAASEQSQSREYATREPDREKLTQLVIEVNALLDVIEARVTELQDQGRSDTH